MNQHTRLLLFGLAGALMIGLFFAGANWQAKRQPQAAAAVTPPAVPQKAEQGAPAPQARPVPPAAQQKPDEAAQQAPLSPVNTSNQAGTVPAASGSVVVNGRSLSQQQVQELAAAYGAAPPPGRYWYDTKSGLWGYEGREAFGYIRPGYDFGPLSADASHGNTGVFINGRQINMAEAAYYQRAFGRVYPGRWWLDGRTGNVGLEGNPYPVANIVQAIQQSQRSSQGGGGFWNQSVKGMVGASEGNCSIVTTDSGSWETPGCSQ